MNGEDTLLANKFELVWTHYEEQIKEDVKELRYRVKIKNHLSSFVAILQTHFSSDGDDDVFYHWP